MSVMQILTQANSICYKPTVNPTRDRLGSTQSSRVFSFSGKVSRAQRCFVAIDGGNFYQRLKEINLIKVSNKEFRYDLLAKWLCSIQRCSLNKATYYIGAIRVEKHNRKSLELFASQKGFLNRLGTQKIDVKLGTILKIGRTYKEKGVDVQENTYDVALLLSSDTDLIPAIEKCISLGKRVIYVGFSHAPSRALMNECSRFVLLKHRDILKLFNSKEK